MSKSFNHKNKQKLNDEEKKSRRIYRQRKHEITEADIKERIKEISRSRSKEDQQK